jgi:hypothetical protein
MTEPKAKQITEADYKRLLARTDELVGACESSPEERELEDIADQCKLPSCSIACLENGDADGK